MATARSNMRLTLSRNSELRCEELVIVILVVRMSVSGESGLRARAHGVPHNTSRARKAQAGKGGGTTEGGSCGIDPGWQYMGAVRVVRIARRTRHSKYSLYGEVEVGVARNSDRSNNATEDFPMGTRQLVAVVVGGVVLMAVGGLLYAVLLAEFFAANSGPVSGAMKETPDMVVMMAANLVYAFLLAVLIGRLGVHGLVGGMRMGAWIGLLFALSFNMMMYATSNVITVTTMLADPIVFGVVSAAGAGVVAAIGFPGKKAA